MINIRFIKDNYIKSKNEITVIIDGEEIINPTIKQILADGWVVYNKSDFNIEDVKLRKSNKLLEYDKSKEVNSFFIGDTPVWIDRDTRVSLMNSTSILLKSGQYTTTLWLDNKSYTLSCELIIQMLGALEIYALQCYNVTAQHKANINSIDNLEELKAYDFKVGYPEKLVFNV